MCSKIYIFLNFLANILTFLENLVVLINFQKKDYKILWKATFRFFSYLEYLYLQIIIFKFITNTSKLIFYNAF